MVDPQDELGKTDLVYLDNDYLLWRAKIDLVLRLDEIRNLLDQAVSLESIVIADCGTDGILSGNVSDRDARQRWV